MKNPGNNGTMKNFLQRNKNATVAITGATGTFGSAFVRRCLEDDMFGSIIALNRDEFKQYTLRHRLVSDFGFRKVHDKITFFLADIRDRDRLCSLFKGVDFIIHTAALKHIDICEFNPHDAVMTNICGTQNIIEAASRCGVKKVIHLSTDKAVDPVNFYGSTKLCAEKLVLNSSVIPGFTDTLFSIVRYGNLVGSSGSVIPLIVEFDRDGKVFHLTDPDMTRLWITVAQAI